MDFEFDERKSQINKTKYGMGFVEAQVMWDDPELLEVPLEVDDEPRALVVGQIGGKHWSAIVTYRQACVRIISVRRSRDQEIALYES